MRKTYKKQKGITLIALVITIIILLILAAVTIVALTRDNGILNNSARAKQETEKAEIIEQIRLDIYEEISDNMGQIPTEANIERIAGEYGTVTGTTFEDKVLTTTKGNYEIKLSEIWKMDRLQPGETATADKNEYYDEEADKIATIPEGFKVSDKPEEISINEGLVVYAPDESEYVWIPVDGILDEDGTIDDVKGTNGEKKILLGRYEFDTNGTPSKYPESYREETPDEHIGGNAPATNIEEFIQSVRDNNGYYIARYEAGVENGELDTSEMLDENTAPNTEWTGYKGKNIKLVSKEGKQTWNYVTQRKASILCQNLYSGVNSDLVNSYAWGTAILYIQKYSGDSDYSRQIRLQSTLAKTGEATDGNNKDERCNIYDMAGNCYEWTTETSSNSYAPCAYSGGVYSSSNSYTSFRSNYFTTTSSRFGAFRPLLYLQ